jgi:antitoxin (DNA-binding transcriptional repressor) of toxin-antitoxin stability system
MEEIAITRHGNPIAKLVPYSGQSKLLVDEALTELREFKSKHKYKLRGLTIKQMIEEGRRFERPGARRLGHVGGVLSDESEAYADAVMSHLKNHVALMPALWFFEVANGIAVPERRTDSAR